MGDILFRSREGVFSYRVAGICIQDGRILLQKPSTDDGFAFPGGHVAFGETNEQTLIREFREEIGAEISVGDLKWVGEAFFPLGENLCHQICLYYEVTLTDQTTPREGKFLTREQVEGRKFQLEFHWIPVEELKSLGVYPTQIPELLEKLDGGVQHFVYREE